MSRTDELRQGGAREKGGGARHPFVKWSDDYAWVEGYVEGIWTGQYGPNVTLAVTNASENMVCVVTHEGDTKTEMPVREGETVNLSLNLTVLEQAISERDVGAQVHVAFEGWQEPQRGGKPYRAFTVLEIEPPPDRGDTQPPSQGVDTGPPISERDRKLLMGRAVQLWDHDAGENLRSVIAEVQNIRPEQVSSENITVTELRKINARLDQIEREMDDDLPF